MSKLITSCGVIKNREIPRVGVIAGNSELLSDYIYDDIDQGIDLTYEEYLLELEEQGKSEQEIEEEMDMACFDERIILFGDAWIKNNEGKYEIDKTKGVAASYDSGSNIITVDWSKTTRKCHHTSPCYIMANGDGPCGNLDTKGDAVLAYDLPKDWYK